jgi:hypothetical protein
VKMHRRGRKVTKETASKVTRERTSSSKSSMDKASARATKALQTRTLTAATGGAGLAAAGVVAGAAGTKRFMAGGEDSQGVFLGPKRREGVDEQAAKPSTRSGSNGAGESAPKAAAVSKDPKAMGRASIVERAKTGTLAEEAQRAYRGSAKTAGTVHRKMAETNTRLQEKRMARQKTEGPAATPAAEPKPTRTAEPKPVPVSNAPSNVTFADSLRAARDSTPQPSAKPTVAPRDPEPPRTFREALKEKHAAERAAPVEAPPPTTRTGSQK